MCTVASDYRILRNPTSYTSAIGTHSSLFRETVAVCLLKQMYKLIYFFEIRRQ